MRSQLPFFALAAALLVAMQVKINGRILIRIAGRAGSMSDRVQWQDQQQRVSIKQVPSTKINKYNISVSICRPHLWPDHYRVPHHQS